MLLTKPLTHYSKLRYRVIANYTLDENNYVKLLLNKIENRAETEKSIHQLANSLVNDVRARHSEQRGILAFIRTYNLSTEAGVVLMCLAEALLRIPDTSTANKLIKDKLTQANWEQHIGQSHSVFVNASTWGLMLTGKIFKLEHNITSNFNDYLNALISKSSEPIIRTALKEAMSFMGSQFVIAKTIELADKKTGLYSFDMLGEAAITAEAAEHYFLSYLDAINHCSKNNTISIKLSALHCRYEFAQQLSLHKQLYPKLQLLLEAAIANNIALTIDAEESARLDIMLDAFEFMYQIAINHNWGKLGLVVQAYQFRSLSVLTWLDEISTVSGCTINVRLVKGAYWDTEIKTAQQMGFDYYPVFTRKENTDLNYLCCAQYLFHCDHLFPQFASHNAQTIAAIIHYAKFSHNQQFEFQRLFGMGDLLYDCLFKKIDIQCRVYAPVGHYKCLLPYLVRRLLENGANNSFVQQLENTDTAISSITLSPITLVKRNKLHHNLNIPLPENLFKHQRINSTGINLTNINQLHALNREFEIVYERFYSIAEMINGQSNSLSPATRRCLHIINPANEQDVIGKVQLANCSDIDSAMQYAKSAFACWSKNEIPIRTAVILKLADLIEHHKLELIALCVRETGRCVTDAISEIREAIDFCRYYAEQALKLFQTQSLTGPTGETNNLLIHARGIYLCISPWNFPIAIFTGQIVAALVTGNCVLAKPAQQSSICASKIIDLCFLAGIPPTVLHFIPAASSEVSNALLTHPDLAGVVFTGSLASAHTINRCLASRAGALIPMIAETSGKNAMIVDSSALPEQVVLDVMRSAFNSAGQRCSSLRFLYLQEDIAATIISLLRAALSQLVVADPRLLSSDIGPLIDKQAKLKVSKHLNDLQAAPFATKISDTNPVNTNTKNPENLFMQPAIYEISALSDITEEIFGPVLHIIRYPQSKLTEVVNEINNSGFGLTLGIHSRISSTINHITGLARVGNIYINRDIIGAVVGVQPFGGMQNSGTGPKAGGPHYLTRFCIEQVITDNITAIGGNSELLSSI